jgi:glycosyltransferase involved in cell wall biosynthesis
MAFAEAMAHGLPVVASGEGAVRDTVPLEAGFVCPVGDAHAIAAAIRALLTDRSLCAEKANAAWSFGQGLPKWEDTARMIAGALRRVLE